MAKSKTEPKAETPKREPQRPAHEVKMGRIRCTVWRNTTTDGKVWYSTTVTRRYKDGDQWKSATSFGKDDLLVIPEATRAAWHWIMRQQQTAANGEGQEAGEDASTTEIPF